MVWIATGKCSPFLTGHLYRERRSMGTWPDQPWHCWKTCWMKYLMKQQGIDGRSNAGNQWIPPESGFDIRTHGDIYIYIYTYTYTYTYICISPTQYCGWVWKGGIYISLWLWHVMNLWTFNRKQDGNEPSPCPVRIGEAYLAESRSSLRQHESLRAEANKTWEPNQERLQFQMK